jgi:hypothetical protein
MSVPAPSRAPACALSSLSIRGGGRARAFTHKHLQLQRPQCVRERASREQQGPPACVCNRARPAVPIPAGPSRSLVRVTAPPGPSPRSARTGPAGPAGPWQKLNSDGDSDPAVTPSSPCSHPPTHGWRSDPSRSESIRVTIDALDRLPASGRPLYEPRPGRISMWEILEGISV